MTFGDPCLPDRFWSKVVTEPNSGCWIWLGFVDKKGMANSGLTSARSGAHRIVKPFQHTAHHKCYVTCCVNPDHLIDVTREINSHYGHRPDMMTYEQSEEFVPF